MRVFNLRIEVENADFASEGIDAIEERSTAIARVLRNVARKLENDAYALGDPRGYTHQNVMDANGNVIGTYALIDDNRTPRQRAQASIGIDMARDA